MRFRRSDVKDSKLERLALLPAMGVVAMGVIVMGESGDKGPIKCFDGGLYEDGDAKGGCGFEPSVGLAESETEEADDVTREDVDWFPLRLAGECEK